jgi:hypothetical protein
MMSGLKKGDNRLLIALLGDEILLRWKHETDGLFAKINARFRGATTASRIRAECPTPLLSTEDLYVFEQCASQAMLNPLFEDNSVASQVVYVSVLVKDFIKLQKALAANSKSGGTDKEVVLGWRNLQSASDKIDEAVSKLFVHIDRQYMAYLESSSFWKNDPDPKKARVVVQAAMARRVSLATARDSMDGRSFRSKPTN